MRLNISIQDYDKPLLFSTLVLCAFGTIMLYSASWSESYIRSGGLTDTLFLKGHLTRVFLGFLCLFTFLIIDYRNLKNIAPYFLIFSLILLVITKGYYLINNISSPARWLKLGPLSFQTSDIARFSLIIFLAYYLDKLKLRIKILNDGFLPCIIIISVMMAFVVTVNIIERRAVNVLITVKNDGVILSVFNTNVSDEVKTLLVALSDDANGHGHAM